MQNMNDTHMERKKNPAIIVKTTFGEKTFWGDKKKWDCI